MAETEIHKWPLPDPTDTPNVPEDMAAFAGAMDGQVPLVCTSTTRPAPIRGLFIYETDTKRTWQGDGTGWTCIAQPWVSYTPVFSGWQNLGSNPISRGEYSVQSGGIVTARIFLRAGSSPSMGTARLNVSLPLRASGITQQFGECSWLSSGPQGLLRRGIIALNSGTEGTTQTGELYIDQGATPVATPGNSGIAWGTGSELHVSVAYQSILGPTSLAAP